jgi:hypothetical protein
MIRMISVALATCLAGPDNGSGSPSMSKQPAAKGQVGVGQPGAQKPAHPHRRMPICVDQATHSGTGRRELLNYAGKFGLIGAIFAFVPSGFAAASPNQNKWRLCVNCYSLFYDGYRNKGRCPIKSAHSAGDVDMSNSYVLTYDSRGPGQPDWRFCNKCEALFFDGYPQKGVCAAGGGHVAAGYNFTLRYDARAEGTGDWHFCKKCQVLYRSDSNKGLCAAGGHHVAAGYNFVLDSEVHYTM